MADNELEAYKQKLKGLTVKELNDIFGHIKKQKFPEKFQAIEDEIFSRTGARSSQVVSEKKAMPSPVAEKTVRPQAEIKPADPAAPPAKAGTTGGLVDDGLAPARAGKGLSRTVLLAVSVVLVILSVYLLLVPFVQMPGSAAFRSLLLKLPPRY